MRGEVFLRLNCIVSRLTRWSKGGMVKGILYRVADTNGDLREGGGRVFMGILYRVADTKGGLMGRGYG